MLVASAAGSAHAQADNTKALAEQLFNQARDLVKESRWVEACPKFEASLRYDAVLGTRLNLATCYEHVGKLASAWGLYRESIELAKKAGDAKRADYAQKQATALEARLPRLAISAPVSPPAGLVVKRDDTPIAAGELGVALYVDPGPHEVTASAPGFESFTQTVTLVERKTETLAIPNLVVKPVASKPGPAVATESSDPAGDNDAGATGSTDRSARTRKYVAIGVGAAGVVALGAGLVFGAKASSTYGDAEALCGNDLACNATNYDQGKQLVHDARSSATVSTVLIVGAGAAIAAGAVVWLTAPRARERTTARLVPVAHDRGAGLSLVGSF